VRGAVSTLYYQRDMTQQLIADRLGLSRPTVSRLIQEAQQQGIVQITVVPARGLHLELETELEERFGLAEVLIVNVDSRRPAELSRQIGTAASGYLARTMQRGDTIGLSWGNTLNAMVQAMPAVPGEDLRIVQVLGGIGPPDAEAYAGDMVRRLAQQLGASPVLLPAPGVVATTGVRDALRRDPHVRTALASHDKLDTVFVGIGSLKSNVVLNDGHSLPDGTLERLAAAGAIGDIALRFFDKDGQQVQTPLDKRILGITVDQLRRVRRVVAVAGGAEKLDAIHAGLRSGLVHVLITDHATAAALVSHKPRATR